MISKIRGKIIHSEDKYLVIDVAGIGFKVNATADAIFRLTEKEKPSEVSLWTHLVVKEDALDLYGFIEKAELDFFLKIISVSGIGPKKGLGILSIAPVETLRRAIATKDLSYLTQVSGIGRKNAEKIILELKDKIGGSEDEISEEMMREDSDALMAIKALGYSASEARDALKKIPKEITGVKEKIKTALKELGK